VEPPEEPGRFTQLLGAHDASVRATEGRPDPFETLTVLRGWAILTKMPRPE